MIVSLSYRMERSSCIPWDSQDTMIYKSRALFVSRQYAQEEDMPYDGYCGYRAVGASVGIDFTDVISSLHEYYEEEKGNEAKARIAYVNSSLNKKDRGIERRGWMNAREDCKMIFYLLNIYRSVKILILQYPCLQMFWRGRLLSLNVMLHFVASRLLQFIYRKRRHSIQDLPLQY